MHIRENVSLAQHSTMRLGGKARYLADITNEDEIEEACTWGQDKSLPIIMIGRGSNIIWRDEGFDGLVLVNKIMGHKVLSEDDSNVLVKICAGENWDEMVAWTVKQDLSGIEYMSLVPGTVGAAPVQNVGAYGGELSDVLIEVEAYDTKMNSFIGIMNESCDFSYRSSRFKSKDKHRFFITGIVLKLSKSNPVPPFYESLRNYLKEQEVTQFTPETIREAVIDIRRNKLPDPEKVSNNGSFFTNPIIIKDKFEKIRLEYPDVKGWPTKDGKMKVAAGWLVEKAGFKDVHDEATGMATWPKQALVLVNEHARKTTDLLEFRQKILFKVEEMFDIILQQEPELLP